MARKKRVQGGFEAVMDAMAPAKEASQEEQPGVCKCGSGGFRVRVQDRKMIRACRECGHEKEV